MPTSIEDVCGVREFYKDKTILITGSTGFLGKILVEKLIRSFPEIKQLFIIVRGKRGKSSGERMENFFENELFARVRNECPGSLSKIVSLEGDLTFDNCGLQSKDIERIQNEVDLVIHSAATVKFDEFLKTAININVRGTLNILNLSEGIKNLQSFIYVSTMYVNCHNTVTEEIIYPHSIEPKQLIYMLDTLDDDTIKKISPALIGEWSNAYTFTKNAAENLVYSYRNHMPVVIFRPSVISAPFKEPVPGWINRMNMGPYGWIVPTGLGLSRILFVSGADGNSNFVPCDYVANAIIAIMWDTGIQRKNNGAAIVNYSAAGNPCSWNEVNSKLVENLNKMPFSDCSWYPMSIIEPSLFHFRVYRFFLQRLPAYLADLFLLLVNKEPKFIKVDNQLLSRFEGYAPFLKDFKFITENIDIIYNKLSEEDKRELHFNIADISWDEYFTKIHIGIKQYLLKEPMTREATQKASIRYFWLRVLDITVKLGLVSLTLCLFRLIYKSVL